RFANLITLPSGFPDGSFFIFCEKSLLRRRIAVNPVPLLLHRSSREESPATGGKRVVCLKIALFL
ncbi:MAG: hypothetical protein IJC27_03430, partial [Lentisphaeria bacterium]|nr:hypothetical protein [Lentisphaeria bacterium]